MEGITDGVDSHNVSKVTTLPTRKNSGDARWEAESLKRIISSATFAKKKTEQRINITIRHESLTTEN